VPLAIVSILSSGQAYPLYQTRTTAGFSLKEITELLMLRVDGQTSW